MQETREENMILTQLGILLKKQFDENKIPFENQMNIDEYINIDQEVPVNEDCNSENWETELFDNYLAAQNEDLSDDDEEVVQVNERSISRKQFSNYLQEMKDFSIRNFPELFEHLKNIEQIFQDSYFNSEQTLITSFFN